jgi:serine/threonine-protein kinase
MMQPIEFGTFENRTYMLLGWISGKVFGGELCVLSEYEQYLLGIEPDERSQTRIQYLSETEQYLLGIKAGEILHKIHSLHAPDSQEERSFNYTKLMKGINQVIKDYHESGLAIPGVVNIFDYFEQKKHLLINRPQSFIHGDYSVYNMIIENRELSIIDFETCGYGDPWRDFVKLCDSAEKSPSFATGQIHGYFGGEPPEEFWPLFALYMSIDSVGIALSRSQFSPDKPRLCVWIFDHIFRWFNNMQSIIPIWYQKERTGIRYRI